MTQQELAGALGLHQSQVSRYARRGMPTHSVAAAQGWIHNNIRLTMRSATYRHQAKVARPAQTRKQIAIALGQVAAQRLQAGEALGELEPALRAALRAIPPEHREPLPYPFHVMDELVRHVSTLFIASMTPAEVEADRAACARMTDEEAYEVGEFWTQVAAGEWQLLPQGDEG
jgi:hypothetical protein